MALIKCPECNGDISDKATVCIHCGYPIQEYMNNTYTVFFKGFVSDRMMVENKAKVSGQIRQLLRTDLKSALIVIESENFELADGVDREKAEWISNLLSPYGCIIEIKTSNSASSNRSLDHIDMSSSSALICPHCGSSAVTTGQRGYSIFTGFIGSRKTTNRCGKCGWTWQP